MSIDYDPIVDLFEAARELEPREAEVTEALTLALSLPQRSWRRLRIVNVLRMVGAIFVLMIAMAAVGIHGLRNAVSKHRIGPVELVEAARPADAPISLAVMARVLRAVHEGAPPPTHHRGTPFDEGDAAVVEDVGDREAGRRRSGTVDGFSRRSRCVCDRRLMRPPHRSLVETRSVTRASRIAAL